MTRRSCIVNVYTEAGVPRIRHTSARVIKLKPKHAFETTQSLILKALYSAETSENTNP